LFCHDYLKGGCYLGSDKFENTKKEIRSRKLNERQITQWPKEKGKNKTGDELRCPEGYKVPAPLVSPIQSGL